MRTSQILTAAVLSLSITSLVVAQDASQKVDKTPRTEVVRSLDRWPITFTYYPSDMGEKAPVVILLHNRGGNRFIWGNPPQLKGFADKLQSVGFAVATVDLRHHGQSSREKAGGGSASSPKLTKRDYLGMGADVEAVKRFLIEEHQRHRLNIRKLAIVGAEMTGPIALSYAATDWAKLPYEDAPTLAACTPRGQDVRALVLLTPEVSVPGVNPARAIMSLRDPAKGLHIMIAAGDRDRAGKAAAKKIHDQLSGIAGNEKRMFLLTNYNSNGKGTDLVSGKSRQAILETQMLAFLSKEVKDADIKWMDRRPRYERDE